jgi:protein tyrosine phosphatase (PTP) superfamily phosphohydrolase (DUF442 family)
MGKGKKIVRVLAFVTISVALGIGGFVLDLAARHNFHSILPGQVYRSAQMQGDALAGAIREHGIKTIVNLRGENAGSDWYQSEISTAKQMGVQHFDFSLSASREVSDEEMDKIIATIDRAPKPVLIHCKNGADRSGLVGALYLYGLQHQSAEQADKQLTIFCGHVPYLFWRDTVAMDRSYWRYVKNHGHKAYPDTAQAVN